MVFWNNKKVCKQYAKQKNYQLFFVDFANTDFNITLAANISEALYNQKASIINKLLQYCACDRYDSFYKINLKNIESIP